eukprot:COSAG01_NODE_337_length_18678_cov_21.905969_17_plen_223_part_00
MSYAQGLVVIGSLRLNWPWQQEVFFKVSETVSEVSTVSNAAACLFATDSLPFSLYLAIFVLMLPWGVAAGSILWSMAYNMIWPHARVGSSYTTEWWQTFFLMTLDNGSFLVLQILIFPMAFNWVVAVLSCQELEPELSVMTIDVSIECDTPEHNFARLWAWLTLCLYVIVFMVSFIWMWWLIDDDTSWVATLGSPEVSCTATLAHSRVKSADSFDSLVCSLS